MGMQNVENSKIESPSSIWQDLKDLWKNRGTMGDSHLSKVERNFLPAALEILETPPSPMGRILAYSLMVLFIIGVFWACIGQVDIIATAQGKIIPSGRVKQIQPLNKSVVNKIYVKEGQLVKQGDPLIELDQTSTAADQTKMAKELSFIEQTLMRLQQFVKLLNTPQGNVNLTRVQALIPAVKSPTGDSDQSQLLFQQWNTFRSKRESLEAQLKEKQAERQSSTELIKQLEETLPIAIKQYQAYKTLRKQDMISDFDCMDKEKAYIEQRQSLAAERSHQQQLAAAVRDIEKGIQSLDADTRRQALSDIQDNERQRQAIQQELAKASDLNAKQVLNAPVSGTVQQLVVTTIGGVVTEAQPLMLIVPRGEKLEAEVDLGNSDIGFVREGQDSEIKIDTFPFTRYGFINAKVIDVTKDAVQDEKKGLIYKMRLRMEKSTMIVDGKEVNLSPGMAVTAEVKTGKRRLIEYILSPLKKYAQESVRER
jgi:hemolysin D